MTKKAIAALIGSIIAIVLAIALIVCSVGYHLWGWFQPKAEQPEEVQHPTLDEVKEDWSFNLDDLDDRFDKFGTQFLDTSMPWKDAFRASETGLKSGAFDLPIKEMEIAEGQEVTEFEQLHYMLEQVEERIWRNPVYGEAVVQAFVRMEIEGYKFTEIYDWADEALEFFNKGYTEAGVQYFLEWKDANGDGETQIEELHTTTEYRYYMRGILTWLELGANNGIAKGMTSSDNWILNMAPTANGRRAVLNTAQENKDCLLIVFGDEKTNQVWSQIGFNRDDGRPELFPKNSRPTNPRPKPNPEPTPEPKPTPDPDPDPTPTPDPDPDPGDGDGKKDPSQDPANQGNAPIGGGKNDDPGPGPYEPADTITPPGGGEGTPTIVNPGNGEDSGYNSGHGPTGTDDTTGDTEPEDANRPVDATDNDTPSNPGVITDNPGTGGSYGGGSTNNTGSGADSGAGSETVTEAIDDPF